MNPACRVCGAALTGAPLLRQTGMPRAAQHLPGVDDLAADHGDTLDLHICPGCGLVQLPGEPVPYWRDVIRAVGVSEPMRAFRRTQFGSFVARHALAGKRLVEIGCGRGEFLALLREVGLDAHGLEHDPAAVAACTAAGLPAQVGCADAGWTDPAPYDAFAILSFLEHHPQPVATLRHIAAHLAPGAVGLVEVPNLDHILRERLFAEFIRDHLSYFSATTLATTLALGGFEVLSLGEVWHGYILSAEVRRRPAPDLGDLIAAQAALTRQMHAFAAPYLAQGRRLAAWGAGHQALALLALTGIAQHLAYVVDSARFKQGRFTPATHLPILGPEALTRDPVAAVLVMAGSYSDEIAARIRAEHGTAVAIAVVRGDRVDILPGKAQP